METASLLRARQVGDVTVVCFLDLASAVYCERTVAEMGEELRSLVDTAQAPNILLDFEGKPFVPFAVFEAKLLLLRKRVASAAGGLGLCRLPASVMDHFRVNRLATLFNIYEDEGEALRAAIWRKSERGMETAARPPGVSDSTTSRG